MSESFQSKGLSAIAAAHRLKVEGYNELPTGNQRSGFRILIEVVRQPMFALLLSGGVIYLLLGDRLDAIVLLLFATLSVSITLVQQWRSEKVLQALRNLASPRARVIRDGQLTNIAGREVVRDDVMMLHEGDRIAADAIVVVAQDLLVDESLLTGESIAVSKSEGNETTLAQQPGGDHLPTVFAGTLVVRGSGKAVVRATGVRSEMGKIGYALQSISTEQPHLKLQLSVLVRNFAIVGVLAGVSAVLLYGLLRGSWLQAMLSGIAIGMSLLPEEFPLVVAVFMAMGAWRISRVRVLTRRASAIESLGATTVLCTDKTGTLTENRMVLVTLQTESEQWTSTMESALSTQTRTLLEAALLACPREPTDPMDAAIHTLAATRSGSVADTFNQFTTVRSYGLRPDLFVVANVLSPNGAGDYVVYAKGAFEAIAMVCSLSSDRIIAVASQVENMARAGIRVLAVARANVSATVALPDSARDFGYTFVGLLGFSDPLRASVPAAVAECQHAGVRVVLITGDYPATAQAIANQAGLRSTKVVSGSELATMTDEQLNTIVASVDLYARVQPSQKLRIVEALKRNGEIVAMTGDGVNDAPAIKAAHIGIAMGGRGTDVAREAAAIVLLNDDFGSIVTTIRLGRRIYDNLRKAIEFIIAVHIPIAGLAILPLVLGMPIILTPILIAFLEMLIDPACSVVFEAEVEQDDVMRRPPRKPNSPLLEPRRIAWAVLQGVFSLLLIGAILVAASSMGYADRELRALVFTSLVLLNIGLIVVNRSFSSSLMEAFSRPNKSLWILVGSVMAALALALYLPSAQTLFHLDHLHWRVAGACLAVAAFSVILLESVKGRWFRTAR
jgi:P-type Ca2+ transporter type 2C